MLFRYSRKEKSQNALEDLLVKYFLEKNSIHHNAGELVLLVFAPEVV